MVRPAMWLPGPGPVNQASAQLAVARLVTTVAAARLHRHLAS
jgi:hypothetical protein